MIDVTEDIQPMTVFKRNTSELVKQMKRTGRPLILTVNGRAEAVVLDAAVYKDVAEHLEMLASLRRGIASAKSGFGRPFEEVFDELDREG